LRRKDRISPIQPERVKVTKEDQDQPNPKFVLTQILAEF